MKNVMLAVLLAFLGLSMNRPAESADLKSVSVVHSGASTIRLPFYVAYQLGSFKQEGLELEIVDARSGSDAAKMLAGKTVQFAIGPMVDAVNLQKQGIDVKGVAMLTNRYGNSLVIRKELADKVKSVKDLKDLKIGVSSVGSGLWQFVVYVARKEGMDPDSLNFIGVGTGANVIGAVLSGRVDAMSYADPENSKLVMDGAATFLLDPIDDATHQRYFGKTLLMNQVVVLGQTAKSDPETVQRFVNAIQRGLNWMKGRKATEIATLIKGFPGFANAEDALLLRTVERAMASIPETAEITRDAYDNALTLAVETKSIEKAVPYEALIETRFAAQAAAGIR